jgi:hypothetical protein
VRLRATLSLSLPLCLASRDSDRRGVCGLSAATQERASRDSDRRGVCVLSAATQEHV